MDAIKHVGENISSVRQVLPGLPYVYPPSRGKLDPRDTTEAEISDRLQTEAGSLDEAIFHLFNGFSPVSALEAAYRLSLQSTKDGKGQVSLEFTGHVSLNAQDVMPIEIYSIDGEETGETGATGI